MIKTVKVTEEMFIKEMEEMEENKFSFEGLRELFYTLEDRFEYAQLVPTDIIRDYSEYENLEEFLKEGTDLQVKTWNIARNILLTSSVFDINKFDDIYLEHLLELTQVVEFSSSKRLIVKDF
jgi:hypothetical protein